LRCRSDENFLWWRKSEMGIKLLHTTTVLECSGVVSFPPPTRS
jgi:hypothetical protein